MNDSGAVLMSNAKLLRLMAEDETDLQVISAAVQDAVAQIGAHKYQARKRRLTLELNRFRWEGIDPAEKTQERVRAILGFDSVLAVRSRGITKSDPELVISILSISFEPAADAPAGTVRILFAGDGEIALDVECLDVTLLDSQTSWATKHTPDHAPRRR